MQLTHTFTVPLDRGAAWATFQDVASVAECFPGAVVTSTEGDSFEGTVKVKLGPVALQYAGSGKFVERDEATGRLVVEAKGRDKRGNGTAGADVTATFQEADAGSTRVEVVTDLHITGKPAQFGRSVMQDVSDKLLGQFVDCLEAKLAGPGPAATPAAAPAAEPAAEPEVDTAAPAAQSVSQPVSQSVSQPVTGPPVVRPGSPRDDALDLGATVLPVLVRSYGRQLAGALVVLLVLRWLLRSRSGRGR